MVVARRRNKQCAVGIRRKRESLKHLTRVNLFRCCFIEQAQGTLSRLSALTDAHQILSVAALGASQILAATGIDFDHFAFFDKEWNLNDQTRLNGGGLSGPRNSIALDSRFSFGHRQLH